MGLVNAVTTSFDGVIAEHGLVGMVDAFCKINGPRGLGDAATFNASTSTWGFTNRLLKLTAGQTPDTTDIGRIWNEGLAFYGWFFYLSKFYEVIDTLIIIIKGKKPSILQTYHHAGAMMCMWAGIRYMAPPIWMFVLVNSFIHVLMVSGASGKLVFFFADKSQYTYYTATACGVKVSKRIKQLITTMQIVQFLVGASFALAHLFISYTIPISVPYIYSFADLTSGVASDLSSAASVATASASAGLGSWLKKVAFRAAGEEGLAENIRNEQGKTFGIEAVHAAKDLKARQETRYREEFQMIRCTDTSGQVFAILINCFYLAPLTWLFVQFFIRSYLKRGEQQQGKTSQLHLIEESSRDAAKDLKRELGQALDEEPGNVLDQDGKTRTSDKEKTVKSNKQDNGKKGTGDSKKENGKENPDRSEDQNMNGKNNGQEGRKGDGKADGRGSEKGNEKADGKADVEVDEEADVKGVENGDANGEEKKDVKEDENRDAKGDRTMDGEADKKGDKKTEDNDGDANRDGGAEAEAEAQNQNENDNEDEDEDKEDIEILDSAEAVADVLDTAAEDADKYSKDLKNSKAG